MKIWLDDIRPAPEGWTLAETVAEVIDLLNKGGVEEISLDNDLGLGEPEGYLVLDYIEHQLANFLIPPPKKIYIHTGNPVAAERMRQTCASIARFQAVLQRCETHGVDE
jgi:hypothetical protein